MIKGVNSAVQVKELIGHLHKRIYIFISVFVFGLVVSTLYGVFFFKPEYTSTGSFLINRTANAITLNTAKELVTSDKVLDRTISYLSENNIERIGNVNITINSLRKGISVKINSNSTTINVSYTDSVKDNVDNVVNAIIFTAVSYGNDNYNVFTSNLIVGNEADEVIYTGIPLSVIYLTGPFLLVSVLMLGFLMRLLYGKNVYFSNYIDEPSRTNRMKLKKCSVDNICLYEKTSNLQNKIESFFSVDKVKVISFVTTREHKITGEIAYYYSKLYSNYGHKVLFIDFQTGGHSQVLSNDFSLDEKTILDFAEDNTHPNPIKINDNFYYINSGKSIFISRNLKSKVVTEFLASSRNDFDLVLINLPPSIESNCYTIFKDSYDVFVINIFLGRDLKIDVDNLISQVGSIENHVYINYIDMI